MDQLSADDLRGTAFAANLRRAFATPAEGVLPVRFLMVLERLGEVKWPVAGQGPTDPRRLEA